MKLTIREANGSSKVVELNKDFSISAKKGQQFIFSNGFSSYTMKFTDNQKSVAFTFKVDGKTVNVSLNGIVPLLNANKDGMSNPTLVVVNKDLNEQNIDSVVNNKVFNGSEIIDNLEALISNKPNSLALVNDFASLVETLEAAAAGGEGTARTSGIKVGSSDSINDSLFGLQETAIWENLSREISSLPVETGDTPAEEIEAPRYIIRLEGLKVVDVLEGDKAIYKVGLYDENGNSIIASEDITVTFKYTYKTASGDDIVEVKSVTIPKGETGIEFEIEIVDDVYNEGTEEFEISIDEITTNSTDEITLDKTPVNTTITDEDKPYVPTEPVDPTQPVDPTNPVDPTDPNEPKDPSVPNTRDNVNVDIIGVTTTVYEGDSFEYKVTLTDDYGRAVKADKDITFEVVYKYVTADGSDIVEVKTVTVPKGSSETTFKVDTVDDVYAEQTETLNVTLNKDLTTVVGADQFEHLTVRDREIESTILDDDKDTPTDPTDPEEPGVKENVNVKLVGVNTNVTEGEDATYKVTLTDDKGNPVVAREPITVEFTYTYKSASGDDIVETVSVVIPKGSSEVPVVVKTVDDVYAEGTEEFDIAIKTVSNLDQFEKSTVDTTPVNTTITDEPGTPGNPEDPNNPGNQGDEVFAIISVDKSTVSEGGDLVYTVTLVDKNNNPVKVPAGKEIEVKLAWSGDAANDTDTTGRPTSVTITGGNSSTEFTVNTVDDVFAEGSEDLVVKITDLDKDVTSFENIKVGTQDTATSTILDNDFKLSTDDSFTICEDTEYKLSINDFGTPLTTITKVKIVELPTNGQLLLNGVAITAGQEISRADIDSGKLVFKPTLHTDVDGNFEFLVHDGSKWATVENTTEIIINAVADAPTTSIDVTKTSTSSSSSFVVEVGGNTYNITDILVNKGTYTEVKNVGNNTSTNATNIVVNENLDANNFLKTSGANNIIVINGDISGGAKIEPMGGNDFIAILGDLKGGVINDSAGIDTLYLGKDSSYYTWDVNTHSGQTGMDGTITQWADKEHTIKVGTLYINNIDGIIFADGKTIGDVTTQNSTIEEYEVDISASLVDRDGSETLTVEISGVPAGAILTSPGNKYQLVDKGNGVWEVKVDSNNPMDVKDKLLLTNVKNGSGWVDLKITATATEGGESCDNGKSKDSVASDATVYGVGESNQVCMEEFKYNLVITLDNSGSMNGTPMTLAKAAMVNLVNKYTQLGDVKVLLNVFNNYGEIKGVWVSPTEAISLINGITAGGGTNYDDALLKNIATLNSNPAPLDGKTISYFVSDGNPTFRMEKNSNGVWVQKGNGSATEYVTKAISDQWKNLDIDKSYAIGIGTNELNTHLNNVSSDVTIISNANQLSDALEGTVQELIYTGTVSDNIIGGDGAIKIDSIVVDGIVYTKSTFPANGVITGNNKIKLTFDFTTGEYKYYAKSSKFSVEDVGFKVNASDSNGDLTSFDVGLKVKVATEVMAPTASIDVINTSTIDYKNATVTTKGYTLEAYNLNGTKGEISIVAGTNVSGFGVKGASSGDESEIGYLNGKSEELRVKFDNKVTDVNVKFSWLASSETAKISFYKDGVLVGTTTQKGLTDTIDGPFNLKPSNGSLFDEIRFSGNGTNDDYIIHSIEYSEVVVDNGGVITDEVYNVNFEAALTGDKGTLSVTISNVPDGASFDLPNMKNLGNGVWEVTISEDDKSIDYSNVKMTVPAGTNYVDLKITATATGDTNCILPENTKTAIDSDATLYAVSESEQAKMNAFKYNLVLTIDNSGSMNGNPITLAKAAMVNLVNKYTQLGDVKVFLTTFSNTAEIKGVWVDAAKAVELINKISTINMTNYDDALLKVIGAMNSTPVPYNDGKTISYFVSDGLPNYGMTKNSKGEWVIKSNANSVNAELSSQYKNLNFDKSYAIGIGTSALNTHLNAVSNDVTIISSATQLSQTLEDTVQELLVEGNFLDNVIGGDGKITADTITFEGKVYTKDTFPSNGIVAGDNHIKLTIDFETGDYRYYAKSSKFTEETKVFTVEASDNNGDKVKYDIEADVKVVTGKAENVQQLMGDDIDLTKVITKTTDVIDLENSSTTDKLKVDLQDILDLNKQQLIIKGDKGDIVELDKNDWTQSGNQKIDGKDYKVYSHNSNVKLLIDDDIDTHNI